MSESANPSAAGAASTSERRDFESEWAEIERAVARLRASVMAVVMGLTAGTGLFVATVWLVVRGGPVVGPTLGLLGQYFPGYTVTWGGAFLGFFYAAFVGASIGWAVAFIYNSVVERRSG